MSNLGIMETFKYKFEELFNPVLKALHALGGSGSNEEVESKLVELLGLSDAAAEDIHRGNTTKLSYRSAWARNYLKRLGLIENSARAVWVLTAKGRETKEIDQVESKQIVKSLSGVKRAKVKGEVVSEPGTEELSELNWTDRLVELMQSIEPSAFERLSQRLLRELGFSNVEVTGKSGDGGIDGVGVIKIGGVLSFHVVFQCKRYTGSVSSGAIRDFRGAMIGRADKGLFVTTGTFTRDARLEAQRDGAPPLDLIDGRAFAEHLRKLGLGVKVKVIEEVEVDDEWFKDI